MRRCGGSRFAPLSDPCISAPSHRRTVEPVAVISIVLFVAMLACLELGRRLGRRVIAVDRRRTGASGRVEAAIFALLGLLLGFAFAGAMSRFDSRRQLVIREANAISTAYLRVDLLASNQQAMRHLFREYLDARIRVYENIPQDLRDRRIAEAARFQRQIWALAVMAGRDDPTVNTGQVVLPAINDMIDVTTARTLALRTRMPTLILALLCGVALFSGVMAGYSMSSRQRRSLPHMLAYAACVAFTVYVVLDLDNPREGLIRLASAEDLLEDLRASIQE